MRTRAVAGQVTEYEWDHRNRLVEITDRTGDGGPIVQSVEYVYDSQNRWIAKSVDPDGPGPQRSTDTHFVYDGNQIVLQVDDAGAVTNRYLWGPAVDQILADEQVQPDGDTKILWPLTDHLNSVRDLAVYNPETNVTRIANHLIYNAYGQLTSQTDPTITSLFGFTARPFDPDTGLQNNLNRWYDAKIGRWLSEDPIGFAAADANLYRYVGNSPADRLDPSGMDAGITFGGGIHTGIEVELRDKAGNVVGILTADFAAKNWGAGNTRWWHTFWTAGEITIGFRPGAQLNGARRVAGDAQQDNQLVGWILSRVGKDRKWLDRQTKGGTVGISPRLDGAGGFAVYRVQSNNCNDFTDAALDEYLGYNWTLEIMTTGADLIQQWDERFRIDGTPMPGTKPVPARTTAIFFVWPAGVPLP